MFHTLNFLFCSFVPDFDIDYLSSVDTGCAISFQSSDRRSNLISRNVAHIIITTKRKIERKMRAVVYDTVIDKYLRERAVCD